MNRRFTHVLSLAVAVVPLTLCGCNGSSLSPAGTEGQAAGASLSTEERFFVGRWRLDIEKFSARLEAERLAGRPSPDAAMGLGMADMMFFDLGDDRSLAWTGGLVSEGWALDQGRVVISYPGTPQGEGMVLSKCADTVCLTGTPEDVQIELVKVARRKPIDPASVAGEWAIDIDASARESVASFKRISAALERIAGKPGGGPMPDEEQFKQYLRTMVSRGKEGQGSIRFVPSADPRRGTVDLGEKGNDFVTRYEVYKDLLLITTPAGGPDKTWTSAMPVADGALTWYTGGQTTVYRKK